VCKGEKTGVWFDDEYYHADKDQGRIFIPYTKQIQSSPLIMIHKGFA
jgi:hypothetical protein